MIEPALGEAKTYRAGDVVQSRIVFITRNISEHQVRDLFVAVQALAKT